MKFALIVLALLLIVVWYRYCLQNAYRIHEMQTPIRIKFENKFGKQELIRIVDSINQTFSKYDSVCVQPPITMEENSMKVCFSQGPCECCLISIEDDFVTIRAVYLPHLQPLFWLTKQEQVSDTAIKRIASRFQNQVLITK